MAGVSVGEDNDNPVAINVTPLVDIIFCLCVFFMISFKFKQIEGKFDTWLPKGKGVSGVDPSTEVISEIRVAMFWDEANQRTIRQYGSRRVQDDGELESLIKEAKAAWIASNKPEVPMTIDAEAS